MRPSNTYLSLSLIGAILGAVQCWGYQFWESKNFTQLAYVVSGLFFVTVFSLVIMFCWSGTNLKRLFTVATGLGALLGSIAFGVWIQHPSDGFGFFGDEIRLYTWSATAFIVLFILLPFAQQYQQSGSLRFVYSDLHRFSWLNLFIYPFALLLGYFTLTGVIALGSVLSAALDLPMLDQMMGSNWLHNLVFFAAMGFAVAFCHHLQAVPNFWIRLSAVVSRFTLPLLSIFSLFLVASVVTNLLSVPLYTMKSIGFRIFYGYLMIAMFNAWWSGWQQSQYHRRVELWLVAMGLFGTLVVAGDLLSGLLVRIYHYGLTLPRFWGAFILLVLCIYLVSYLGVSMLGETKKDFVFRRLNLTMAVVVVVLGLLLHLPWLDASRFSVWQQEWRLSSGGVDVAEFDFVPFRYQFGYYGKKRLQVLGKWNDPGQTSMAKGQIASLFGAKDLNDAYLRAAFVAKSVDPENAFGPVNIKTPDQELILTKNITPKYSTYRFSGVLAGARPHDIAETDKAIWFGTDQGLLCYRKSTDDWVLYGREDGLPFEVVTQVAATAGPLAISLSEYGQDGDLVNRGTYFGYPEAGVWDLVLREEATDLYADGKLFWQAMDGAYAIDLATGQRVHHLREQPELIDNHVNAVTSYEELVWFALDGGVKCFNRSSGEWKSYTSEDGLAADHAVDIAVDSRGVWVVHGEGETGLSFMSKDQLWSEKWEIREQAEYESALGGQVLSMLSSLLVVSQDDKLLLYDDKNSYLQQYHLMDHCIGNNVVGMASETETLWIGVYDKHYQTTGNAGLITITHQNQTN